MTSVPSVKMGGTMSIYRRIQEHHSIGLIRNELDKIGGGVDKIEACKMKGELYGRYPIHTCVIFEYPEALQELIQRGADVNKRTTGWTSPKHSEGNGKTALCYACELKKLAIMDILLEAGARVLADDRLVCKTIQSSDRDADVSAMKERLDLLLRKGARNPSDVEASVLDAIPLVWGGHSSSFGSGKQHPDHENGWRSQVWSMLESFIPERFVGFAAPGRLRTYRGGDCRGRERGRDPAWQLAARRRIPAGHRADSRRRIQQHHGRAGE